MTKRINGPKPMQIAQVITTVTKVMEIIIKALTVVKRTTAADKTIPWGTLILHKTTTKIIISVNGIASTGMLTFNGDGITPTNHRVRP